MNDALNDIVMYPAVTNKLQSEHDALCFIYI